MADQLDIDNLVRQLQDLIPVLQSLDKTPTTAGNTGDRGSDKIVLAIAKLSAKLDENTKTKTKENLEIAKFTKEIDDATESTKKLIEQQETAAKEKKRQDEELAESQKRAAMSADELAKYNEKVTAEGKINQLLLDRKSKEAEKKNTKTANSLLEEYGRGVTGTAALREKFEGLGSTSMGATVGLKLVTSTLDGFVKAMSQYVNAIYEGEQGAAIAAKSVTTFADTLGGAMQVLGGILLLIPGFQLAGAGLLAVGTAGKFAAKANEKVAEMSDRVYVSYQELSKSGVTAADGMTGAAESAQKLGYGLDKIGIGQFNKLMAASSKDLAMFAGSAVDGRLRFSEFSGEIVHSDLGRKFMNMGMSVDDINEGTAGFLKQQVSLGRAQTMTNAQLKAGANAYLGEMDALTKLTGIQKKELESQLDSNRRNERFRAAIEKTRREQGNQAAQNLELNMAVASERFPELSEGLKDIAAGFFNTEAAQKAYRAGLSEIPKAMTRGLGSGFQEMGIALKQTTDSFGSLAEFGGYGGAFGNFYESLKAAGMSNEDAAKRALELLEKQKLQGQGIDAATASQTDLRRSQMNTRDSLQDLVKLGVNPSTKAMEKFSSAVDSVANKLLGRPGPGFTTGGPPTTGNAQSTANTGTGPAPTATTGGGAAVGNPNLTRQADRARQSSLADKIIQAESGGRNIGNIGGTSTAFGVAQFTKGTFEGMAKQAGPTNPLYGKTFEDYKADVGLQREALRQLMDQNRQSLAKKGLPTTDPAIYLAHFLGATGASRLLSLPDTEPITSAISAEAMAANPGVFKNIATVGDLKGWASQKMGGVGYDVAAALGGIVPATNQKTGGSGHDIAAALGGIIPARKRGTRVLVGEAGLNEAFVPLPDGKTIPVTVNFAEVVSKYSKTAGIDKMLEQIQGGLDTNLNARAIGQAVQTALASVMNQNPNKISAGDPQIVQLMSDLVGLQRDSNNTARRLLQVSTG